MTETTEWYSPENMNTVVPYLPRTPKWLLLGGPADAREAQTAIELWPEIKVIGVEPNPEAYAWQLEHGWPKEHGPLIEAAVSNKPGFLEISAPSGFLRSGRVTEPGNGIVVPSVIWDELDKQYGPVTDAVLWMDIETHELEGLQGATGLLERRAIILINIELQTRMLSKNIEIQRLLDHYGFKTVKDWNDSPDCRDTIFVLQESGSK